MAVTACETTFGQVPSAPYTLLDSIRAIQSAVEVATGLQRRTVYHV